MSIPFTQYLLPDGRRREVWIDRPKEIETQAHAFINRGGKFDIEMLTSGNISMTAELDDEVVGIEIAANGPSTEDVLGVPEAVDRLVRRIVRRSQP